MKFVRSSEALLEEAPKAPESASLRSVEPTAMGVSSSEARVGLPSSGQSEDATGSVTPAAPGASLDSEPKGMATSVTPSGIEVYFQAAPKRLYRLRPTVTSRWVSQEEIPWTDVPSVSEVLEVLDKPGLSWWGQQIGVEGVQQLYRDMLLPEEWAMAPSEQVVALLTAHKLTCNHQRDKAGDRGTAIHDALEVWAEKGVPPQPSVYAPEEQGYVKALSDFLIDSGVEPVRSEVMVGSLKYRYAGRYDLDGQFPNGAEVVVKTFPKRKPVRERIEGGLGKVDLKTSKGIYASHHLQLEAYEGAAVECGYPETDFRAVLHVTEDGRYELVRSKATFEEFLAVKAAYDALEAIKGRK